MSAFSLQLSRQTFKSLGCVLFCRSLGVHCSKVRSLTLDSWEPELLKVMFVLGVSINTTQVLHTWVVKYKSSFSSKATDII